MMPNGMQWVVDTVSIIVVLGLIVGFAVWTSGTNNRKQK